MESDRLLPSKVDKPPEKPEIEPEIDLYKVQLSTIKKAVRLWWRYNGSAVMLWWRSDSGGGEMV